MSRARIVVVRPAAAGDLARIARSISHSVSASAATKWRVQIEAAIRSLAEDADTWPEADEAARVGRNLRVRPSGRRRHVYRILFTVEGETVTVLRVRHAAQDYLTEDDF